MAQDDKNELDILKRSYIMLEREKGKLIEKLNEQIDYTDNLAHLVIEAGIVPGINSYCRCEQCRSVAQSMDEAGYLEREEDKWWRD